MYNVEIFDNQINFVDQCMISSEQTVDVDFIAVNSFTLNFPKVLNVRKGWYAKIWKSSFVIGDFIISDYQPEDTTCSISFRPLMAILDFQAWNTKIEDSGSWIKKQVEDFLIDNSDSLQNIPIEISSSTSQTPVNVGDDYSYDVSLTVLNVAIEAMKTYNVVVDCSLNMSKRKIVIAISRNVGKVVVESGLPNVLDKTITLGDSYGSYNKMIIEKYTIDPSTEERIAKGRTEFYLHTNGSIDTTNSDRISPVFWILSELEEVEDVDWDSDALAMANEQLSPEKYDNNIELTYRIDDMLEIQNTPIGTTSTIIIHGSAYISILTGKRYTGNTVTLIFGTVRIELTKQLIMEEV